jgi:hypothetical protein
MSDGYGTYDAVTANYPYRCVCPVPVPTTFTGANCFGPPGAGSCFKIPGIEGGKLNMDAYDRAPAAAETAVFECGQAHAHVATTDQYVSAILAGAPNGGSANGGITGASPWNTHSTGPWVHVADMVRYDLGFVIYWLGNQGNASSTPWQWPAAQMSWEGLETYSPYRCVGYNVAVTPPTVPALDSFTIPTLNWNVDGDDQSPSSYIASVKDCITRGGHLPTVYEAAAAIYGGAPNGTGQVLYTSDGSGYNGTDFLVQYLSFAKNANLAMNFYDSADGNVSWIYRNSGRDTVRAHRCIYYPTDPTYAGPAPATCQGGACFKVTLANTSHMWFDSFEVPSDNYINAFNSCQAKGGRLASERDITEGAISGLGHGSNSGLWTTDMELGSSGQNQVLSGAPYWNGVDLNFNDLYSTYSSWAGYVSTASNKYVYRCMWTDELR